MGDHAVLYCETKTIPLQESWCICLNLKRFNPVDLHQSGKILHYIFQISPMIVNSRYFSHDCHVQAKKQALCLFGFNSPNPKDFPCWSILVTHRKTSRTLTWPSHHERRTNSILFGSGRQKLTDFLGQSSGHSLWIREMRVLHKKGVAV